MTPMTLQEAAINTSGTILGNAVNQQITFNDVATDSRVSMSNKLFIALKGENFNGHDFLDKAVSQGAVACMLDEDRETTLPVLKVDNTIRAMGKLAKSVREKILLSCIGITGSCGKTTVKEMIASILTVKGKVLATKGNFNNAIGVPLTLFRLSEDDQFAVIEMGASKSGDIDEIAQLVMSDVAVITNIGAAHLQGLGTIAGVAKVKGELLDHLDSKGTAVIEYGSPWIEQWNQQLSDSQKVSTFSGSNIKADFTAKEIQLDIEKLSFLASTPAGDINIQLAIPGKHNIENALAAMAASMAVGASLESCQKGLAEMSPVNGRLQVLAGINGSKMINDSYNSNPISLKAAIEMLSEYEGKKVLVLGDMAELGEGADTAHFDAGQQAKEIGLDAIYATGKLSLSSVKGFGKGAEHFESKELLSKALKEKINENWTLLIKGSRSAAMEEVVVSIQEKEVGQPKQQTGAQICY
ncbi:MAG: UDP-N-acetylmuramoyl-tripeptide--D-alanyl-D-alanine ligase [Gammaproteobacteria bacterium]|nr:UDP-N-acetylmuramoyl-tripeptide--D-alanyl-D-alanine ligase [Gammaproteobacteria bacterium]